MVNRGHQILKREQDKRMQEKIFLEQVKRMLPEISDKDISKYSKIAALDTNTLPDVASGNLPIDKEEQIIIIPINCLLEAGVTTKTYGGYGVEKKKPMYNSPLLLERDINRIKQVTGKPVYFYGKPIYKHNPGAIMPLKQSLGEDLVNKIFKNVRTDDDQLIALQSAGPINELPSGSKLTLYTKNYTDFDISKIDLPGGKTYEIKVFKEKSHH